jgi:hypothetical protein
MDRALCDEYCFRARDVSIHVVDVTVLSRGSNSSSWPWSSPSSSSSRGGGREEPEYRFGTGRIETAETCEWCKSMGFIICMTCRAFGMEVLGLPACPSEVRGPGRARSRSSVPRTWNCTSHFSYKGEAAS